MKELLTRVQRTERGSQEAQDPQRLQRIQNGMNGASETQNKGGIYRFLRTVRIVHR